jgi:hypothetical protein
METSDDDYVDNDDSINLRFTTEQSQLQATSQKKRKIKR